MAIMKFKNVVLKNLFSKPVTKNYPAEPAVYPERSRGHVEINIDDEEELADKYEVSTIPCLVLERDGEEVAREIGVVPPKKLEKMLEK